MCVDIEMHKIFHWSNHLQFIIAAKKKTASANLWQRPEKS